jgi:uncharacterized membrane protein (UPF0127 family)
MAVVAFLLLTAMTSCDRGQPAATSSSTQARVATGPSVILADGYRVSVEIAADDATRQQGLMYRDRLPEDRGMIFLFRATGEYAFWMKNTLIPLDMIWIDEQKQVVHVAHDVPPCKADPCPSYPPNARAKYVLELAAGVAAKHRIANGQTLRFEAFDNVTVE